MKFCRFNQNRYGVIDDDQVRDISDVVHRAIAAERHRVIAAERHSTIAAMPAPAPAWSDAAIAALPAIREMLLDHPSFGDKYYLGDVRLEAPVEAPGKIIGAPVNYSDHINEMIAKDAAVPHTPRDIGKAGLFLKANSSLAGPASPLKLRFPERRTDHEVELVAVIGRTGSNIGYDDALSYVAGYSLGLDISLRGPEDRSFRKSLDGYSVLGPWLITPDEFGNPDQVEISLAVNGVVRQQGNTADLIYNVARLIEFASKFYTLYPGDLLYTGTPAGVGPIVPGDVIDASGHLLGELRIEVIA